MLTRLADVRVARPARCDVSGPLRNPRRGNACAVIRAALQVRRAAANAVFCCPSSVHELNTPPSQLECSRWPAMWVAFVKEPHPLLESASSGKGRAPRGAHLVHEMPVAVAREHVALVAGGGARFDITQCRGNVLRAARCTTGLRARARAAELGGAAARVQAHARHPHGDRCVWQAPNRRGGLARPVPPRPHEQARHRRGCARLLGVEVVSWQVSNEPWQAPSAQHCVQSARTSSAAMATRRCKCVCLTACRACPRSRRPPPSGRLRCCAARRGPSWRPSPRAGSPRT